MEPHGKLLHLRKILFHQRGDAGGGRRGISFIPVRFRLGMPVNAENAFYSRMLPVILPLFPYVGSWPRSLSRRWHLDRAAHIAARRPRERLPHLLRGPLLRGVFRHPEVQHPASLMREHHEDEQDPEGRRRHGEKIDGRGLRQMIRQECSPSLGRRFAGPRQISGHRGLRHGNPQFEQFSVNAGCTPQGVGLAHAPN